MANTLIKTAKNAVKKLGKALKRPDYKDPEVDRLVRAVMKKTGWSYACAWRFMSAAKQSFGIPYDIYYRGELWSVPPADQKAEHKTISEAELTPELMSREHVICCVMKHTGWEREYTEEQIAKARKRCGCSYKEYLMYRFFEMDEHEQDKVFLLCDSKKLRAKYDVDKELISMLRDKEKTNIAFSEMIKRRWCVNRNITYEEFAALFKGCDRLFYKPVFGSKGIGAEVHEINRKNRKTVYNKLMSLPKGVVEEFVIQHPDMAKLAAASVNTLRVVTLSSTQFPVTADGKHADVAYASIRIGNGEAVVDNFHSGGMTAAVDIDTGIIVTNAVDMGARIFENHPFSGEKIKGTAIPFFRETIDTIMRICEEKELTGYLGWDIAITKNGPELIELNSSPGVMGLSAPYATEHIGMKHVMEKYI